MNAHEAGGTEPLETADPVRPAGTATGSPAVGGSGWGCGLVLGLIVGVLLGLVLAVKGPELFSGVFALPEEKAPASATWHCPMHPTVTSDHPGKCPLCGMDLVPIEGAEEARPTAKKPPEGGAKGAATFHCPMHPTVTSDHPGKCPLCGMDLEPIPEELRAQGGASIQGPVGVEGLAEVTLDTRRQQLIGLKLSEVARGPVRTGILTSGRVVPDETKVRSVTLQVEGRIERLRPTVGSSLEAGAPLLELYSPDWIGLQQELLLARQTDQTLSLSLKVPQETSLLEATKRKLARLGIPAAAIQQVLQSGQVQQTLTIPSPFSGVLTARRVAEGAWVRLGEPIVEVTDLHTVWILADLFEDELSRVQVGTPAVLRFRSLPEQRFDGKVSFIERQVDAQTRAIRVRLEVPNPRLELRPELFGEIALHSGSREGLRIPADAIIDSGTRKIVFVSAGQGRFAPRSVTLGVSDGEFTEVTAGLEAGEQVVRRALFLIDSESRLKSALFGLEDQ